MTAATTIALSALYIAPGSALASWRHPDADPGSVNDISSFIEMAQLCERGMFDLFFIADTPAARTDNLHVWTQSPMYQNSLEPITLLAAVAGATTHIGLGATCSTSFFEPFNIARQFSSLDHISHGRAAWNVVTSANDYAARNFGADRLPPRGERYEKAREAIEIVTAYWDTWEDDAFVYDKAGARNFDPAKFHPVRYSGTHFTVDGGLNIARSPQGKPVVIEAGASDEGKELAAETADVVFGTGASIEEAQAFYTDLKGRMAKFGRAPDELKILSGISAIIGVTEEEALAKKKALDELVPDETLVMAICNDLETDLFDLPLDELVPLDRIPATSNFHQTYFTEIAELIRSEKYTLREIARKYNRGSTVLCGTATQVADFMENWIAQGGGDGFMFTFTYAPGNIVDFVEQVVPILQDRGLVKTEWPGTTLRENLGLARPANVHAAQA